jgi:hypothetical protein
MYTDKQMESMMKAWGSRQERQAPLWEAWHEKFGAGTMTCREYLAGPDFSSVNPEDESKIREVELKLDGVKEFYADRDRECRQLEKTFILDLLKIPPDAIVEEVGDDDLEKEVIKDEEGEEDEVVNAEPIDLANYGDYPGYAIWEGEESFVVFKEGERIGDYSSSCRGNMYHVSVKAYGETYTASDKTHGKFE